MHSSLIQRQKYARIHLNFLSPKTRKILSEKLNKEKCIQSESDNYLSRDWRGIFELCKLQHGYYDVVDKDPDHMDKLIKIWCADSEKSCPGANVENLLLFLEKIDRFDVFEDVIDTIDNDVTNFEEQKEKSFISPKEDAEFEPLTLQDLERTQRNLPLKIYDAFILFEDEDHEFVSNLLQKLSNHDFCKKSDLILQTFEHTAVVELIEKRCRRVIAVISECFLNGGSNSNTFLVNFAQAAQVENGSVRIIPIVLKKEVEKYMPSNLKYLHKLYYYKNKPIFYEFWDMLDKNLMDKTNSINSLTSSADPLEEHTETKLLTSTVSSQNSFLNSQEEKVDATETFNLEPSQNIINSVESTEKQVKSKNTIFAKFRKLFKKKKKDKGQRKLKI